MARSRVELFEQIRRDSRVERLSIRELAEKYQVHRRTVRQALENAIYVRVRTPGCYAWQIDGTSFSYTIAFHVTAAT